MSRPTTFPCLPTLQDRENNTHRWVGVARHFADLITDRRGRTLIAADFAEMIRHEHPTADGLVVEAATAVEEAVAELHPDFDLDDTDFCRLCNAVETVILSDVADVAAA